MWCSGPVVSMLDFLSQWSGFESQHTLIFCKINLTLTFSLFTHSHGLTISPLCFFTPADIQHLPGLGMDLGALFVNQLIKFDGKAQEDLDKLLVKAKQANERRYFGNKLHPFSLTISSVSVAPF